MYDTKYDTKLLIKAIKEDDPIASYRHYADWLSSHFDGDSRGGIFLQQAIERLAENLEDGGSVKTLRELIDHFIFCERIVVDKTINETICTIRRN